MRSSKNRREPLRARRLFFDFFEQRINAPGFVFTLIVDELYGWHEPEIEFLADSRSQKTTGTLEPSHDFISVRADPKQVKEYFSMPEIFADFYAGQIKPLKSRVMDIPAQQFRYHFEQQISDAL